MNSLESVLRRDRIIVAAALLVVTALAWFYIFWLAEDMAMGGMDMTGFRMVPAGVGLMLPAQSAWQPMEFLWVFAMWAVMMIGMMTPSAAPMILLYSRMGRQAAKDNKPFAATGWFATGYLLAWAGFSLLATLGHWLFDRSELLDATMASKSNLLGGIVLLAAGAYQFTPLKNACLHRCQTPWQFLSDNGGFRREALGALSLGARHGLYCVGCCWILMALLFIGGAMNLLWIAGLSIFVLAERVSPAKYFISWISGAICVVAGLWLLSGMHVH
jgi:predicted metal-binding membrane protein